MNAARTAASLAQARPACCRAHQSQSRATTLRRFVAPREAPRERCTTRGKTVRPRSSIERGVFAAALALSQNSAVLSEQTNYGCYRALEQSMTADNSYLSGMGNAINGTIDHKIGATINAGESLTGASATLRARGYRCFRTARGKSGFGGAVPDDDAPCLLTSVCSKGGIAWKTRFLRCARVRVRWGEAART